MRLCSSPHFFGFVVILECNLRAFKLLKNTRMSDGPKKGAAKSESGKVEKKEDGPPKDTELVDMGEGEGDGRGKEEVKEVKGDARVVDRREIAPKLAEKAESRARETEADDEEIKFLEKLTPTYTYTRVANMKSTFITAVSKTYLEKQLFPRAWEAVLTSMVDGSIVGRGILVLRVGPGGLLSVNKATGESFPFPTSEWVPGALPSGRSRSGPRLRLEPAETPGTQRAQEADAAATLVLPVDRDIRLSMSPLQQKLIRPAAGADNVVPVRTIQCLIPAGTNDSHSVRMNVRGIILGVHIENHIIRSVRIEGFEMVARDEKK